MYMYEYNDLQLEVVGSLEAGRVISKLVTFADAVSTVSSFFHIPLDEKIANWKYQEIRLRTAQPQPKVTGFYQKSVSCRRELQTN